jgi:hypothetical protein
MNATLKPGLLRPSRIAPDRDSLLSPTDPAPIDWPTDEEMHEVSRRLAAMNKTGARWEAEGDYFNSGDLAYQLREIIRGTAELFRKTQRLQR